MLDRPTALLISGPEYVEVHRELEEYLKARGIPVQNYISPAPESAAVIIRDFLMVQVPVSHALVSYQGHGSTMGWHTNDTDAYLSYEYLVKLVASYNMGYLKFAVSTCFAQRFIGHFIMSGCERENISIYTPQFLGNCANSYSLAPILVDAWQRRQFAVERHSMTELARVAPGTAHGQGIQAYGVHFDHYFW